MRKNIRLCGSGGQGIMTAGYILGKAASVFHDYNAVQMQSYGPEARGGAARSEVVISDREIGYCGLPSTDNMMVMSQPAWDKYHKDLTEESIVVLDPDLVVNYDFENVIEIPATQMAEDLGNKIVANIVMIGGFNAVTKLVPDEALEESVKDSVPKQFTELNFNALKRGRDYVTSHHTKKD
ncbi:MAG: 2-oxoacid:acceptor oxidoreductase family protein [Thermoplasmata archaeon]